MKHFLMGMVCGATLLFVAMHYHVVRGKDGVVLVPKISNNLSDIYVDVREFDLGAVEATQAARGCDCAKQSSSFAGGFFVAIVW